MGSAVCTACHGSRFEAAAVNAATTWEELDPNASRRQDPLSRETTEVGRTVHGDGTPKERVPLILISDPGQDLDDEMTYIMLRYLVYNGYADLRGIVTTLAPAFDRARLCRGTLDTLGLYGVPIGVGTDGGDTEGKHKADTFEVWAHTYMPAPHSASSLNFEPGLRLLHRLYKEAQPKSLTLVVIAALKDPALFLRDNEELFEAATREVVIMGGVDPWEAAGEEQVLLQPDTAHNNMFDAESARYFYRRCQELRVPLIVVSRWSAYAAKVPRSCYDDLAALGSAIGCRLRNAQRASIETLWARACAPAGGKARQGLPDRCDRKWFLNTFCGGHDDEARGGEDTIWDLVVGFMQYDTLATLAALPSLRQEYFAPAVVTGKGGTQHLVIGRTEQDHGVADSAGLADFLNIGFSEGLALNHSYKARFILLTQPRWNNRADELVACVMLRSLYELGIMDCAGIVVSPGPGDHPIFMAEGSPNPNQDQMESATETDMAATEEQAKDIERTLKSLGLAHVPVLVAKTYGGRGGGVSASDHLKQLYDLVPPAGVSLVCTATVGDVEDFAQKHPQIFRERTQAVVLVSGALVKEHEEDGDMLQPDPVAQNNRLDLPAAQRFFKRCQQELVPLIILSRHFAKACMLPRAVFDALGAYGGKIGAKVRDVQKESIAALWRAACAPPLREELRRGLPRRCDRKWFLETFCPQGITVDDADIWPSVGSFAVYGALAILASIPTAFCHVACGSVVVVRSVSHTVVGISAANTETAGVRNIDKMRRLLCQSLFMGTRLNASEFERSKPPPLALGGAVPWHFDPSAEALDWLLEPPPFSRVASSASLRVLSQAATIRKEQTVRRVTSALADAHITSGPSVASRNTSVQFSTSYQRDGTDMVIRSA